MSPTGADALVAALEDAGVAVVFGLPGVHNLAAWEALRTSPIRLIGVRHEQTAAYAADGHARATGAVGVALVTTGPGAANTLGAVGEAWASRSPIVVIATDVPAGLRREGVHRGMLHEVPDQAGLFRPLGQGDAGIEEVIGLLDAHGYERWLVLEQDAAITGQEPPVGDGPIADVRQSIAFLNSVAPEREVARP